jgi:hypothetical protein
MGRAERLARLAGWPGRKHPGDYGEAVQVSRTPHEILSREFGRYYRISQLYGVWQGHPLDGGGTITAVSPAALRDMLTADLPRRVKQSPER